MSDSSYYLVVDIQSGTCFSLQHAYLVDTAKIPEEQLEEFNSGNDNAICQAALDHGVRIKSHLNWIKD